MHPTPQHTCYITAPPPPPTTRLVQTLSLGGLCVLAHALHTQLPVLTGDRHWATLARHGLVVDVHLFRPHPDPPTGPSSEGS